MQIRFLTNSLQNLRMWVIMIAVMQTIAAHIFLFTSILALTHAEQMTDMLMADIAEQKDHEFYIAIVTNDKGESVNQLRFESANKLATITLIGLYIGATISTIYLICCVALLMGVLKNKFKLMYGWVIMDVIGIIVGIICAIYFATPVSYAALGGKIQYWTLCHSIFWFDVLNGIIVILYCSKAKEIESLPKLKIVPVRVPCQTPIPYYYRKENMYMGNGGYKHVLKENDPNYVV